MRRDRSAAAPGTVLVQLSGVAIVGPRLVRHRARLRRRERGAARKAT
jgi:hypothetical protein